MILIKIFDKIQKSEKEIKEKCNNLKGYDPENIAFIIKQNSKVIINKEYCRNIYKFKKDLENEKNIINKKCDDFLLQFKKQKNLTIQEQKILWLYSICINYNLI